MAFRDSLLIFLIGVVIFTVGLGPEFTGFDCRFAMFAQEMLRNGPTFFPTTYDKPYADYPATSTFLIYLTSLPFGKATPFTTILPTAVVSALILVVIYRIGAIRSRQWGIFAAMIAVFTIRFLSLSRSISTDQYTGLATALCFYLIYSADEYKKYKRLWFVPLLFLVSFAFRGPIGLVVPAAVVCAYYFCEKKFKLFVIMALATIVLFVVCFYGLLQAAAYQGGTEFAQKVWKMQMAGRVQDVSRHNPAYYWFDSFAEYAIAYPFAVLVIIAGFKKILKRENAEYRLLALLAVWMVVVLAGMSVPSTKKIRYVLPMVPAAALIAAYLFMIPLQKDFLSAVRKIFLGFCRWFPAGAFIGIAIFWAVMQQRHLALEAYYLPTLTFMLILAVAGHLVNKKLKESFVKEAMFLAMGVFVFVGIIVGVEEPIGYGRDRTRPFVEQIKALQSKQPAEIVFYKISADGDAIKFMVNIDKPLKPQFVKTPETLFSVRMPAYCIAEQNNFDALPQDRVKHIASGRINGDDCVVFTLVQ
jgi:4-amino-4-deoxy-L-arabinose transferase-like glycosyltransferase